MHVRVFQAHGFRNLVPTVLEPSARFNIIAGANGQGKTNLLEALYLLGTLRSFRSQKLAEMIGWGETQARVAARIERGGLERLYEVQLSGARKDVRLDGKMPRRAADYFGDLNVVLFAPEDLRIFRGGPGGRRRFLDRSVFNREVTFLDVAQRHARALKARNALLRDGAPDPTLLAVYDEQVAQLGAKIIASRRRYLETFAGAFQAAHAAITSTPETVSLAYEAPAAILACDDDEARLTIALHEEMQALRRRELLRGQTLVGPHVDDLIVTLDGHDARTYASQGQLRTLVLAWKTAEMRFLALAHGDMPVLLLDDVSSELDPARNRYLFEFLAGIECQCFVTTTHPQHVLVDKVDKNRVDFQMVGGQVGLALTARFCLYHPPRRGRNSRPFRR